MKNEPAGTAPSASTETLHGHALAASLTVKDLQKSLAWYRDVAGFTVNKEHERGGAVRAVSLKAGGVEILIGQDDGAKGWDRAKGEGFSLRITTSQDIDALAAAIKARGGTLDMEPMTLPWGARVFRIKDPDGFKIAISS